MGKESRSIRSHVHRILSLFGSLLTVSIFTCGNLPCSAQSIAQAVLPEVPEAEPLPSARPSTILPTDVVPLPGVQERTTFGENLQLRVLQRLPAPFYFNVSCETSFRYETNVFQFPTKRKLLLQLPTPQQFATANIIQQRNILRLLNDASHPDNVFRVLPNVTGGWAFTPRTRVYANYFMIRDELMHVTQLNTVIHSVGGGIQHDIPIGRRGNLQFQFQGRELWQLHSRPVWDYLPSFTFSYVATPRMVVFVNSLLQLRGERPFQAPEREIDPFYTFGSLYQKGKWAFSATGTFVQNFRDMFNRNASIPINSYSWICDFEIARRVVKGLPGLQAFLRAEPIYNFHSHNRPGLSGMDFRIFYGLRMALGKPPLTAALEQIRQQLEEQEGAPPPAAPPPEPSPGEPKPSAYLMPYQVIADHPQPIHGALTTALVDNDRIGTRALHGFTDGSRIGLVSYSHLPSPFYGVSRFDTSKAASRRPERRSSAATARQKSSLPAHAKNQPGPSSALIRALPKHDPSTSSIHKRLRTTIHRLQALAKKEKQVEVSSKTVDSLQVNAINNKHRVASSGAGPQDPAEQAKVKASSTNVAAIPKKASAKETKIHRGRAGRVTRHAARSRAPEPRMILIPPMPTLDLGEHHSSLGLNLTPPIMMNVLR